MPEPSLLRTLASSTQGQAQTANRQRWLVDKPRLSLAKGELHARPSSRLRFFSTFSSCQILKIAAGPSHRVSSHRLSQSRHKSAHADASASVALRPRWFTPCSTKLLSATYCATTRAMRRNMKRRNYSAPSTSWMQKGSVPETKTGCLAPVLATNSHPATHRSASYSSKAELSQ